MRAAVGVGIVAVVDVQRGDGRDEQRRVVLGGGVRLSLLAAGSFDAKDIRPYSVQLAESTLEA